jgi:hypothetical protein
MKLSQYTPYKKPTDTSELYPKVELLDEKNPYWAVLIEVAWWLLAFVMGFATGAFVWGRLG